MKEDLVGYFLGALDRDAEEQIEKHLAENPLLRRELDRVGSCLKPLDADADVDPPVGLAERTVRRVLARRHPELPTVGSPSPWRLTDLAIAASILMMIGVVIFPAISQSRDQAQLTECKNNLRQIGIALDGYADRFAQQYPFFTMSGPFAVAGIYAPVLIESGFAPDASVFVCPSAHDDAASIPKMAQLRDGMDDVQRLSRMVSSLGGSYAYSLGFTEGGVYYAPRRDRLTGKAIVADRPARSTEGNVGHSNSPNHRGRGQNTLCVGGNVKFLTCPQECTGCDNVFISERNRVEPGSSHHDAVLGVSEARLDASDGDF